jgi:hypothetical protein
MGEKRNACRLFVGKPVGKRPLGRPGCRWMNDIGMDLGDTEWDDVGWIGLAQELVNKPSGCIKCSETIEWLHN